MKVQAYPNRDLMGETYAQTRNTKGKGGYPPFLLHPTLCFVGDHILQQLALVIFTFITGCKGHAAQNFAGLG